MALDTNHTFTDKSDREISFEICLNIVAHIDGERVGQIEFDEDDQGHPYLFHMEVKEDYRRAGIATEMIRLAALEHGRRFGRPSLLAQGGAGKSSSEYFTQEGAALIYHCIEKDIIDDVPDPDETLENV